MGYFRTRFHLTTLALSSLALGALFAPGATPAATPSIQHAAATNAKTKAQGPIQWVPYDQALAQAKASKRPLYLQFHANWCPYCKKLEKESYSRAAVQKLLNTQFIPVRLTEGDKSRFKVAGETVTVNDLFAKYQVTGFPTLVFLSADGQPLGKTPGYVEPQPFEALLSFVASESYNTTTFAEYQQQYKPKQEQKQK